MSTAVPLGAVNIRHYRQVRGVTLEEMGKALQISASNAYYKETMRQGCTLTQFAIIVQRLRIPPGLLLDIPFTTWDDPEALPRPHPDQLIHIPCCYTRGG